MPRFVAWNGNLNPAAFQFGDVRASADGTRIPGAAPARYDSRSCLPAGAASIIQSPAYAAADHVQAGVRFAFRGQEFVLRSEILLENGDAKHPPEQIAIGIGQPDRRVIGECDDRMQAFQVFGVRCEFSEKPHRGRDQRGLEFCDGARPSLPENPDGPRLSKAVHENGRAHRLAQRRNESGPSGTPPS